MLMNGNCSAESLVAADYATNSTYAGGWTPSTNYDPVLSGPGAQNGGYGLGADSGMGYHYPGSGLQIGETFSTIISNPTDRGIYRGYTIVLSNFPENISYNNRSSDTVLEVGTFEYGTHGRWYTSTSGAT